MNRRTWAAVLAVFGTFLAVPAANAATVHVDDDGADCPSATQSSVQAAVNAANPGDTVAICPGTYVEGNGSPGTSALTINKSLTIKGAGSEKVKIQPKRSTPSGGQIAAGSPALRDAVGNIITIQGGTATPVTVDISGVTVDGNGVYVEGGVLYLDAQGSLVRDRITNTVTSDANNAFNSPGGYRASNFGFGVAQATQATSTPPGATTRTLTIDRTRIDKYNKVGLWVDSATGDTPPLTASGVVNAAVVKMSKIVGRNNCPNYIADGMCQSAAQLTSGPLFGQDGMRVTAGATANVQDSLISSNMVNGSGSPTRSTNTTPNSTNNAQLVNGAGVRLNGAGASTFSRNNIVDNAYGLINTTLDGTTASATQVPAENNWWGIRYTSATNNVGPAISPTSNPPIPENPVNGTIIADPTCIATNLTAVNNSTAVDFCPYRNGSQGDPNTGEYLIVDAPVPVADAAPTVALDSDETEYDRGDVVHLTATADDDFGVNKVTFFNGLQQLDVDTTSPYEQDFTIPANAPCGSRSFSAVVEDSSGQTASDEISVDVVGPDNCEDPPDAPQVTLDNPPANIPQAGVNVTATASAEAGVDEVQFFLGTRLLCEDDTAPYSCDVLANGDEVGDQTLRAVVVDDAAQTAEDSAQTEVDKFDPDGLSLEMDKQVIAKSKKKKTVLRTISGAIDLPARVEAEDGCDGGNVSLTVEQNGVTLFPSSQVSLQDDCTYSLEFTIKEKKKKTYTYDVDAGFSGNDVLNPISNTGGFSR
jgi:hypothetical protein